MLQLERSQITVAERVLAKTPIDIQFPRSLQRACVLLVMEEITLDQFIDCLISEGEFDETGRHLLSLMSQIKALADYFEPQKANKFIMQLMIKLHIKVDKCVRCNIK